MAANTLLSLLFFLAAACLFSIGMYWLVVPFYLPHRKLDRRKFAAAGLVCLVLSQIAAWLPVWLRMI